MTEIPEVPQVPRVDTSAIMDEALERLQTALTEDSNPQKRPPKHRKPRQERRWWRWPKFWGATRDKAEEESQHGRHSAPNKKSGSTLSVVRDGDGTGA